MKCENCNIEFSSLNWYKLLETSPKSIILCDDCVRQILEAKIQYHKGVVKHIQGKIDSLPKVCSIDNESKNIIKRKIKKGRTIV